MSKGLKTQADPQRSVLVDDPAKLKGKLKKLGGSNSDEWNHFLGNQALQTHWTKNSDEAEQQRQLNATVAAMMSISPRDELEGMMVAQLIAAHNAAMECYRRAMLGEQTFEGRRENLKQAAQLSRSHAALTEALNKYRGKGQQKVTVEHVHIHSGGQAVVGVVGTPGGGGNPKSEEQAHAKQITHASQPALRSADEEREPVPVSSDEKRPVPDARGKGSRRSKR